MLTPRPQTPAALGYRFPAEWEPHAATWLSWPRNPHSWPGKFEVIPPLFAQFVKTLAEFEPVHINAGGAEVLAQAQELVGDVANVTLHDIPTNDAWCRDHGPMFLVPPPGEPPALVDWEYNAWGGKYPPFDLDNAVPGKIARLLGRRRFAPGIVLEGGAVEPNGRGTILTTEECLLNPNRNPHLGRAEIEQYLADYCGAKKVLWLGRGFEGDDTDGHIDQLARFVNPTTVLCVTESNRDDPNFEPLAENWARLHEATDQEGRPLTIVPLPMPGPKYYEETRLPAGYANFYIANGVVVVPVFDDPHDQVALDTLGRLFPGRAIRPILSLDLIWGFGAFHCLSQQEPAVDAAALRG